MATQTEHILVGVSDEGSYDMRYTGLLCIELDPKQRATVEDFVESYREEALASDDWADEQDWENGASWGSEKFCRQFIEDLLMHSGVVRAHFLEFAGSFE